MIFLRLVLYLIILLTLAQSVKLSKRNFLEAVYMSFHFGVKRNIFAMSQLQTTRNELITVCESEMKLISGSWNCDIAKIFHSAPKWKLM